MEDYYLINQMIQVQKNYKTVNSKNIVNKYNVFDKDKE